MGRTPPLPSRRPGDHDRPPPRSLPAVQRFAEDRRDAIDADLRSGAWRRVRRGVYVPAAGAGGTALEREARVLAEMRGVAERLSTRWWFSHTSAALLWGCWVWRLAEQVHVTQLGRPSVRRAADPVLRRHHVPLPERDRTMIDGVPVTGLERTVVDCARSLPAPQAVVVADSGLRLGADPDRLAVLLAEAAGGRGVRRARRVLAVADPRSESPGESVLRWLLLDAGLPAPVPALGVETWAGRFWLDLGWPEERVGLEFDGAVKYAGTPEEGRRRLLAEKRRHDALRESGWTVLRVTWADLDDPALVVGRVRRVLPPAR